MHWSPWATVLLQQSRAFTGIRGLQWKCFPQMHHQQTGDPTPQLQPFCSCSCSRIPAFHSQRASLFTSLGALSFCLFCLFRLISSLLLVRKGHEDQDNTFLLPSLQHFFFFFGKRTSNFFSLPYIFAELWRLTWLTIQQFCCPGKFNEKERETILFVKGTQLL